MPSMMLHLTAARMAEPEAETLFWLGNIAPDAVPTRERKDVTHFRTSADRMEPLEALKRSLRELRGFDEGVLLHLYLDYLWDSTAYVLFREKHTGDQWFTAYRDEIAQASAWLFHHSDWSEDVWTKMLDCPAALYGKTPDTTPENVYDMLKRNYFWHRANSPKPPQFFTPSYINAFLLDAVQRYKAFLAL